MQVLPRLKLPNYSLGRNRSFRSRNLGSGGWTSLNFYTWRESIKSPFPSFRETKQGARTVSGFWHSLFTYVLITVFVTSYLDISECVFSVFIRVDSIRVDGI
jgi:hypothetical protein